MAPRARPFRYFDLPGEIRNHIMSYILIPGDVYIRPPRRIDAKEPKAKLKEMSRKLLTSTQQLLRKITSGNHQRSPKVGNAVIVTTVRSALEFLATCRQMRLEGSPVFYGMNNFHLPHGPISNTIDWLLTVDPGHGKHIRAVLIAFDERDVTLATLNIFDQWRQRKSGHMFNLMHPTHLPLFNEPELAKFLGTKLWKEKWMLLRRWRTLEAIYFSCGAIPHTRYASRPGNGIRVDSMQIPAVITDSAALTAHRVVSRIRAYGWRATKAWLLEMEQQK